MTRRERDLIALALFGLSLLTMVSAYAELKSDPVPLLIASVTLFVTAFLAALGRSGGGDGPGKA